MYKIEKYIDLFGVVDTQILVEDVSDEKLPESLSGLVLKYNLHPSHFSRKQGAKGAQLFDGCHNVGNDSVPTT